MIIKQDLRRLFVLFLLCNALLGSAVSTPDKTESSRHAHPEFVYVMSRVREQLPQNPLLIAGRLLRAPRTGAPEPVCLVNITLLLGQSPPTARYSINDMFGDPIEQVTIKRKPDLSSEILYETGSPPAPAPAPDLREAIHESGITWSDLSMSFLWRNDGMVAGSDSVRGRDCIVVEFAQPGDKGLLRLWIDNKLFMAIQAEEYDASGTRVRRLSVKSIKKINETWVIKDMEVRRYPSMERTLLRIDDVQQLDMLRTL